MIIKKIVYTAKCDHCGIEWEDAMNDWIGTSDKFSIITIISEEGWEDVDVDGDVHYCPDCYFINDDDNIKLREHRKNQYL